MGEKAQTKRISRKFLNMPRRNWGGLGPRGSKDAEPKAARGNGRQGGGLGEKRAEMKGQQKQDSFGPC